MPSLTVDLLLNDREFREGLQKTGRDLRHYETDVRRVERLFKGAGSISTTAGLKNTADILHKIEVNTREAVSKFRDFVQVAQGLGSVALATQQIHTFIKDYPQILAKTKVAMKPLTDIYNAWDDKRKWKKEARLRLYREYATTGDFRKIPAFMWGKRRKREMYNVMRRKGIDPTWERVQYIKNKDKVIKPHWLEDGFWPGEMSGPSMKSRRKEARSRRWVEGGKQPDLPFDWWRAGLGEEYRKPRWWKGGLSPSNRRRFRREHREAWEASHQGRPTAIRELWDNIQKGQGFDRPTIPIDGRGGEKWKELELNRLKVRARVRQQQRYRRMGYLNELSTDQNISQRRLNFNKKSIDQAMQYNFLGKPSPVNWARIRNYGWEARRPVDSYIRTPKRPPRPTLPEQPDLFSIPRDWRRKKGDTLERGDFDQFDEYRKNLARSNRYMGWTRHYSKEHIRSNQNKAVIDAEYVVVTSKTANDQIYKGRIEKLPFFGHLPPDLRKRLGIRVSRSPEQVALGSDQAHRELSGDARQAKKIAFSTLGKSKAQVEKFQAAARRIVDNSVDKPLIDTVRQLEKAFEDAAREVKRSNKVQAKENKRRPTRATQSKRERQRALLAVEEFKEFGEPSKYDIKRIRGLKPNDPVFQQLSEEQVSQLRNAGVEIKRVQDLTNRSATETIKANKEAAKVNEKVTKSVESQVKAQNNAVKSNNRLTRSQRESQIYLEKTRSSWKQEVQRIEKLPQQERKKEQDALLSLIGYRRTGKINKTQIRNIRRLDSSNVMFSKLTKAQREELRKLGVRINEVGKASKKASKSVRQASKSIDKGGTTIGFGLGGLQGIGKAFKSLGQDIAKSKIGKAALPYLKHSGKFAMSTYNAYSALGVSPMYGTASPYKDMPGLQDLMNMGHYYKHRGIELKRQFSNRFGSRRSASPAGYSQSILGLQDLKSVQKNISPIKGISKATKEANRSILGLNKSFKTLNESSKSTASVKTANKNIGKTGISGKKAAAGIGLLAGSMTTLAIVGATVVTGLAALAFGFFKIGKAGVQAIGQMQMLEIQFSNLLKNSSGAKDHIEKLADFAASTPFQLPGLAQASRYLLMFGGEALATEENLRKFGDAAAGTSAPIEEVGMWIGRAYSSIQSGQPFGDASRRLMEMGVLSAEATNKDGKII